MHSPSRVIGWTPVRFDLKCATDQRNSIEERPYLRQRHPIRTSWLHADSRNFREAVGLVGDDESWSVGSFHRNIQANTSQRQPNENEPPQLVASVHFPNLNVSAFELSPKD